MDGYTTLYGILETALKAAGGECAMLLGQELSIILSESSSTEKNAYCAKLDDSYFIMGVNSAEPYEGRLYLVFNLRDAIVLSSILLGIPPARIKEKKLLGIIEKDDIDAFAEVGNMINGSLNSAFLAALPSKPTLKLLPPNKYIPKTNELNSEEPFPDGDYLMFRSKLELPGMEMECLDVLVPTALANLFDPQVAVEVATEDNNVDTESLDKEGSGADAESLSGVKSIVVLEDDVNLRQQMVELLAFTGFQIAEGTLNADLKELFAGRNVKMAIIGSQNADERELAVCIKVKAMRQDSPPPIIMIAEFWTRTAALKALKYGASDIIIKPFTADEVVAKVRNYCKIAQA